MRTTTKMLIAGEAIREGDPLTVTKVLKADADGSTFEIGVMKPDDPNGPVGPLGVADRYYARGNVISRVEMPAIDLAVPAVSWESVTQPTPVANILALRDRIRKMSRG